MLKTKDLSGQTFGKWLVLSSIDKDKWLCQCVCGNQNQSLITTSTLKYGLNKGCKKCFSHRNLIDLSGKKFGLWTVISLGDVDRNMRHRWLCECECGKHQNIRGDSLKDGKSNGCRECIFKKSLIDLTGQQIGAWKVLKRGQKDKSGYHWICECKCGTIKSVTQSSLRGGTTLGCKKCHHARLGKRHPIGYLFAQFKSTAKKRNISFEITKDYVYSILEKQNFKCALTDLPIKIVPALQRTKTNSTTASIDRINPNKGYINGNLQWVHRDINWMKYIFSQEDFIKYCNLVSKKYPISTQP